MTKTGLTPLRVTSISSYADLVVQHAVIEDIWTIAHQELPDLPPITRGDIQWNAQNEEQRPIATGTVANGAVAYTYVASAGALPLDALSLTANTQEGEEALYRILRRILEKKGDRYMLQLVHSYVQAEDQQGRSLGTSVPLSEFYLQADGAIRVSVSGKTFVTKALIQEPVAMFETFRSWLSGYPYPHDLASRRGYLLPEEDFAPFTLLAAFLDGGKQLYGNFFRFVYDQQGRFRAPHIRYWAAQNHPDIYLKAWGCLYNAIIEETMSQRLYTHHVIEYVAWPTWVRALLTEQRFRYAIRRAAQRQDALRELEQLARQMAQSSAFDELFWTRKDFERFAQAGIPVRSGVYEGERYGTFTGGELFPCRAVQIPPAEQRGKPAQAGGWLCLLEEPDERAGDTVFCGVLLSPYPDGKQRWEGTGCIK